MKEKTTNRTRPAACCSVADPGSLDAATLASYAALFAALADPTRLGIINLLANNDEPVCVCDITDQFDKGQPTISHHLSILREAGLVSGTRAGIWSFYALNRERLAELQAMLDEIYHPLPGQPLRLMSRPAPTRVMTRADASA
jgi:ArsR family transcriptional regulator